MMVAYMRAVADVGASHVRDFRDPTARVFLNAKWLRRLQKVEQQVRSGRESVTLAAARVSADMMALRTATIDAAVQAAVTRGTAQLVILGAGLDGRAWRMSELAGVRVFEVDHPATQGIKRARVAQLPPPIGILSFVSIDFERESLDKALDRAGHDRKLPTCWIWEGVVMYLTHDAMQATLAGIAGRSANGSTLIVNYHTAHRRWLARLIFRLIGEPQISAWAPEEMATDLRSAGFVVREDTGMLDWNAKFARGEARVQRAPYMRVAVAKTLGPEGAYHAR